MSPKAIFITFGSFVAVLVLVGFLSYWMASTQPTADITPPSPPIPQRISLPTTDKPPVPDEPRFAGDAQDDGIVNGLDISVLIAHWKQNIFDYNLVDDDAGAENELNAIDLSNVISHWRCLEQKPGCPYL